MILLDTSVLVRYLRTKSPAIREIFVSTDCGISGVTRAEILHGARTSQDAADLREALNSFIPVITPESFWDRLGENLAALRAAGLPLPFQDVLVATIAVENQADLWAYDAHFKLIQGILPNLKLFEGPTA